MTDPREHALAVVRESLEKDPQFLIALQYLGMLKDDALLPLKSMFPNYDLIGSIEAIPVARPQHDHLAHWSPAQQKLATESMALRFTGDRIMREQKSPIHPETGRTLFSMWVEKEIPWSPAVMGWTDDDPRIDAMLNETGG